MTKRLLVLLLLSAAVLLYRGTDLNPVDGWRAGGVEFRPSRPAEWPHDCACRAAEDLDGRPTTAARMGLKVGDAVVRVRAC